MTNGDGTPDLPVRAGQGRLAQVLATRGGKAAPEAPFVIEHREALIYMLCEAAELEHGIMCQYLFAAFSLKQAAAEGLTQPQLAAVTRWRKQVSHVATQEMLHLALVHNLLSAIGAAPHLARPNLPQPADHYPAGVQLALLPFGEQALRHFMFLERPEGMDLQDAEGLAAVARAEPMMSERDIVPRRQDFATVGHLYRSIEAGIAGLVAAHGEDWLFVGPPRAQATQDHFRWPELVAVTDAVSAQRAIDTILEQGEGPRGDWRNAHFGQFVAILDDYEQMTQADPAFAPVRPVVAANVRPPESGAQVPLISDPLTARVTDLFNVGYEILLQIFERYFAHTQETDVQLKVLADATVALMLQVIKPLGDLITTLPVGPGQPGSNAGPSFELFYETDYLMPHRDAAWALLTERLAEAAWLCEALREGRGAQIGQHLEPVLAALRQIARTLAVHLPAGSAQARQARQPEPLASAQIDELTARAAALARGVAGVTRHDKVGAELAAVFALAHAALAAAADAGSAGHIAPRLADSVLRPLAGALARYPGEPAGAAPAADGDQSEPQAAGELVWQAAQEATRLRARLGAAGSTPPELAEATAALQDLACGLAPTAERAGRLATLAQLQSELPALIQTAKDGPYLVTNVPRLLNYLGEPVAATPQAALCRCGGSAIKPFCDGTHARNGFSDVKEPRRVPDRRDSYPGQQVTILDNRGLCQHSGYCTDRLPAAFRTGQEPFVAPSGGRMDEIIRAARDCPSGALSFAIEGHEERDIVDWGGHRDPAIEVTRDGPYRITGAITLVGADGTEVERNAGASREHCALCRCGHSQNKPFCSGMHWYAGFRDPVPDPGHEPTLFEWAGGLPALTRMTRLLYEKHVPADDLLAPLFASMPPEHPRREAMRLAESLGGAAGDSADHAGADQAGADQASAGRSGPQQTTAAHAGRSLDEQQRARWVTLAIRAADEAGLPADAQFRSAFTAYVEWDSRVTVGMSQPDWEPSQPAVAPWGWTAAGPPDTTATVPGAEQASSSAALPGPGEAVSFGAHIKPLFRESDRQSMSFVFDLWSYADVRAHAADILDRLRSGSMPCDGAWSSAKVKVFHRWADSGMEA
jgi:CDGSH-type Zn-finger protein/truncated hemoglobin YjbI